MKTTLNKSNEAPTFFPKKTVFTVFLFLYVKTNLGDKHKFFLLIKKRLKQNKLNLARLS